MYLERKRLNFDGCYISKATYARAGEPSLDHFYRPWHVVEYYRYLRFFPNGTVVMLTSPDEPKLCVGKFKTLNFKDTSIIKGKWTLESDHVIILIKISCDFIFKN
jgi:F-box protein 9